MSRKLSKFPFQTVKISLSKLSKFPFPNCQNFPFQTVKISILKLSKFPFSICQNFHFQTVKISISKLSKLPFPNCQNTNHFHVLIIQNQKIVQFFCNLAIIDDMRIIRRIKNTLVDEGIDKIFHWSNVSVKSCSVMEKRNSNVSGTSLDVDDFRVYCPDLIGQKLYGKMGFDAPW